MPVTRTSLLRGVLTACLASGQPRRKWDEMLQAQGADLDAFRRKLALDHPAPVVADVTASREGFVSRCDARIIGEVIRDLGGGRMTKDSAIQPDVGVDALAKPGEAVRRGALLCRVHAANQPQAEQARQRLASAFEVSAEPPVIAPLIVEVI